ncbi:hypothetical protein [Microseira wollei]|uniref:hypothetical protein n=1 Tax=Microseira wollei TaxID=467598 RepID=UPI001CFF4145|nr:hypothetical protein [Microseira wollei]
MTHLPILDQVQGEFPIQYVAVEVKLKNTVVVALGGFKSKTFFLLGLEGKTVELVVVTVATLSLQTTAFLDETAEILRIYI